MNFLLRNINMLFTVSVTKGECDAILGPDATELLMKIFGWIQIATPCLVLVLCLVDLSKAVIAQDDNAMKKAQNNAIKRVIIGVAIFFVPIIINLILEFAGIAAGTCEIGIG